MKPLDCDRVRELLADRHRIGLVSGSHLQLEAHLDTCDACRADADVIRVVQAATVTLPAGLEDRVVAAVRRPPPRRRWVPAHFAIAASVVFALLAGGMLLRGGGEGANPFGDVAVDVGPAIEQPLLQGAPSLAELSIDELEALLAEMES